MSSGMCLVWRKLWSRSMRWRLPLRKWLDEDDELHEETLRERILDSMVAAYKEKEKQSGAEVLRHFEKAVMLQILDGAWKEHLGCDGLPAAGYRLAWLWPERSQAGVQEGRIRDVFRHA